MKTSFSYESKGVVLGNYWGGGQGSYPCIKLGSDISEEDLLNQNIKALNDGSLDSEMGFESLIGALINIETIRAIEIEDRIYRNSEFNEHLIGNLNDEQEEFLFNL
jgi:hypothetical protein